MSWSQHQALSWSFFSQLCCSQLRDWLNPPFILKERKLFVWKFESLTVNNCRRSVFKSWFLFILFFLETPTRSSSRPHDEKTCQLMFIYAWMWLLLFFCLCKKGREGKVRTEARTKKSTKKGERNGSCWHRAGRRKARSRGRDAGGRVKSGRRSARQALSWRHHGWLMEWELVWQSKAGCHVTEGEQETGEQGLGGGAQTGSVRACACARACSSSSSLCVSSCRYACVCAPDTFCRKKGRLKVNGMGGGQNSVSGARQASAKKFGCQSVTRK